MDATVRIGALLGGRYRLRSVLGEGAMGTVYLAEHEVLLRPFAVKVLRGELAQDERLVKRFQREARAASRIQHPNIVYISDFGTTSDGSLFLVMEYIPGQLLRDEITRSGALVIERSLKILYQVADALDCAHRANVIHRDLKPENLLLVDHRGKPDFVKVLDFGVAKIVDPEQPDGVSLTGRGELYGTPEYMAPEQILGKTVTNRSDIYSLGVVAYEMVTGSQPFTGSLFELVAAHTRLEPEPPSQRCPAAQLSPALDVIIGKCLAKDPDDRYATARELKEAFARLYRIVTGRAGGRPRIEDTDLSSPLRQAPLVAEAPAPREVITSAGSTRMTDGGRSEAAFERVVRDLAEGLRDHGLGSLELAVVLTRLLTAEERMFAEQADLALCEAQLADTDQTMDEREARLRQAIIQVNQELARRERMPPPPAPSGAVVSTVPGRPPPDLQANLADLEHRLAEVQEERERRVCDLEPRIATHRAALDTWSAQVRTEARLLLELVLQIRPEVEVPELRRLYRRLDQVKTPTRSG